jgi:hypothetical protein|tara:strand:+ start:63 stop:521 length:459 start_codon:yes stop_codon:yes gene_type:complete
MRNPFADEVLPKVSRRSYVYYNLQRHVWSERQNGRVIGHPEFIWLENARFLVGKAGQAKVRAEGRKNVHAGISGKWLARSDVVANTSTDFSAIVNLFHDDAYKGEAVLVTYNPYQNDTFVLVNGGNPVTVADKVAMFALPNERPYVLAYNPR